MARPVFSRNFADHSDTNKSERVQFIKIVSSHLLFTRINFIFKIWAGSLLVK